MQKQRLYTEAHRGGGLGIDPLLLKLKKQHNFVDIMQFVMLCYIDFSLNEHIVVFNY